MLPRGRSRVASAHAAGPARSGRLLPTLGGGVEHLWSSGHRTVHQLAGPVTQEVAVGPDADPTQSCAPGTTTAPLPGWVRRRRMLRGRVGGPAARAAQTSPSSLTASRSSTSSATDASMRPRENSSISRPWTISHLPATERTGKEEMIPSGTP